MLLYPVRGATCKTQDGWTEDGNPSTVPSKVLWWVRAGANPGISLRNSRSKHWAQRHPQHSSGQVRSGLDTWSPSKHTHNASGHRLQVRLARAVKVCWCNRLRLWHYHCELTITDVLELRPHMHSSQSIFSQLILVYKGPLQFNIFMNGVEEVTEFTFFKITDDTNSGDPDSMLQWRATFHFGLVKLKEWANRKFLKFSKDKCQVLLLGRKHWCK